MILQTANVVFLLVHVSDDTVEAYEFMVVSGEVIIMIYARNIWQILYFRFPQIIISIGLTSKESFPSLIN